MKTQETFKKKSALTVVPPVINYFLSLPSWKLSNMYLNSYEKGWPWFCPFKPYWKVQSNISGIFEPFSIRSCPKKMKTEETFNKKSALTVVPAVINYFLISTLLETMYLKDYWKGWPWFCPFKPYSKVQSNISGFFERFSIRLCPKKWRRRKP